MPLRVAFDLDGTIADMSHVLRAEAERLFGEAPSDEEAQDADGGRSVSATRAGMRLSRAQQTRLWEHVKTIENFWAGLPEIEPGIVSRIAATASERRWEVIFLTTRPFVAGDTVQLQTQHWLEAHGFRLPSVFVVQRSRGRIAEALELDAVVDDRPENCLDVALDSKAAAILVWRGTEKPPLGVDRLSVRIVPTISDALRVLVRMDGERQPRVVRTLRKLFGKETIA